MNKTHRRKVINLNIPDTQANKWQLTINSTDRPVSDPEGNIIKDADDEPVIYNHDTIKEILSKNFTTLQFYCLGDEKGSNYHTHIFLYFTSRVRFSKIKKAFPTAHIEKANANISENIMYIRKEGKWADTEKSETSIAGSYEEWGVQPPDSKGRLADMSELYQLVKDGASNSEIIATNQDYILCIDKIDRLRTTLLIDKYKSTLREDLHVCYISGDTAVGKTRGIIEAHGAENIYRVTDYQHPFDHYENQPVLVFDEFRSNLPLSDMLNYLDVYPLVLPARYSNKYSAFCTVYLLSNWRLEDQYSEKQRTDIKSWKAFLRRIHEVRVYTGFRTYETYNSVDEYFERGKNSEEFVPAKQIEVPFE